MKRGQLFVISGPSGVGKSTVVTEVRRQHPELYFSVSATTRAMRESDIEGVTYWFKTREEFERMVAAGEFFEHAEYAGNLYGTLVAPVMEQLENGRDVLLEIDVQGGLQARQKAPEAVLIFVAAPSFQVLESRLRGRGDTAEEAMEKRLAQAREEYKVAPQYDYIVVNDALEEAIRQVDMIMETEKLRAARNKDVLKLEELL